MKKLLALFSLGCALIAAEAPQTHRVDNLGNCYRLNADGSETNLGQPADAIANNPGEASGIQRAALKLLADFQVKLAADIKAAQDSAAASVKAAQDAATAATEAAQKASADAIAANAADLSAAKAELAALKAELAAVKAELAAEKAKAAPASP